MLVVSRVRPIIILDSISRQSRILPGFPRWNSNHTKQTDPAPFLHKVGDHPYGSRKYILVNHVSGLETNGISSLPRKTLPGPKDSQLQILATLCAKGSIVFGASVDDPSQQSPFTKIVSPLLDSALTDCSSVGEQPQALSTLHGLSAYVRRCLEGEIVSDYLRNHVPPDDEGRVILNAVKAVATGSPLEGQEFVGKQTHETAAVAWESLAKEYVNNGGGDECQLYREKGAQLVSIELLADTNEDYLESAGGAMARFFFA